MPTVLGSSLQQRYRIVRNQLDHLGYEEAFPIDALSIVERLVIDLLKTKESLKSVSENADYYYKVAKEHQFGVEPFKDETIRLCQENNELKLQLYDAENKSQNFILENKIHIQDLEDENKDLKILVKKFIDQSKVQYKQQLKELQNCAEREENSFDAVIITSDGERTRISARKLIMDISCDAPGSCPFCIRIRNYVNFTDPENNPNALDYIKIADSRIECLQLQCRKYKDERKQLITSMQKMKMQLNEAKPSEKGDIDASKSKSGLAANREKHLELSLKASQMQFDILQKKNMELERKLRGSMLNDKNEIINRLKSGKGRESLKSLDSRALMRELEGWELGQEYPSYDEMSAEEKLTLLEAQLSHCCEEKAKLKYLLEQCDEQHKLRAPASTPSTTGRRSIYQNIESQGKGSRLSHSRKPSWTPSTGFVGSEDQLNVKQAQRKPSKTGSQHDLDRGGVKGSSSNQKRGSTYQNLSSSTKTSKLPSSTRLSSKTSMVGPNESKSKDEYGSRRDSKAAQDSNLDLDRNEEEPSKRKRPSQTSSAKPSRLSVSDYPEYRKSSETFADTKSKGETLLNDIPETQYESEDEEFSENETEAEEPDYENVESSKSEFPSGSRRSLNDDHGESQPKVSKSSAHTKSSYDSSKQSLLQSIPRKKSILKESTPATRRSSKIPEVIITDQEELEAEFSDDGSFDEKDISPARFDSEELAPVHRILRNEYSSRNFNDVPKSKPGLAKKSSSKSPVKMNPPEYLDLESSTEDEDSEPEVPMQRKLGGEYDTPSEVETTPKNTEPRRDSKRVSINPQVLNRTEQESEPLPDKHDSFDTNQRQPATMRGRGIRGEVEPLPDKHDRDQQPSTMRGRGIRGEPKPEGILKDTRAPSLVTSQPTTEGGEEDTHHDNRDEPEESDDNESLSQQGQGTQYPIEDTVPQSKPSTSKHKSSELAPSQSRPQQPIGGKKSTTMSPADLPPHRGSKELDQSSKADRGGRSSDKGLKDKPSRGSKELGESSTKPDRSGPGSNNGLKDNEPKSKPIQRQKTITSVTSPVDLPLRKGSKGSDHSSKPYRSGSGTVGANQGAKDTKDKPKSKMDARKSSKPPSQGELPHTSDESENEDDSANKKPQETKPTTVVHSEIDYNLGEILHHSRPKKHSKNKDGLSQNQKNSDDGAGSSTVKGKGKPGQDEQATGARENPSDKSESRGSKDSDVLPEQTESTGSRNIIERMLGKRKVTPPNPIQKSDVNREIKQLKAPPTPTDWDSRESKTSVPGKNRERDPSKSTDKDEDTPNSTQASQPQGQSRPYSQDTYRKSSAGERKSPDGEYGRDTRDSSVPPYQNPMHPGSDHKLLNLPGSRNGSINDPRYGPKFPSQRGSRYDDQKRSFDLPEQQRQRSCPDDSRTSIDCEREVLQLKASLKSLDRDKDEMRAELDKKDEKLAALLKENTKSKDEINKLQLKLKQTELQLNHIDGGSRDLERESAILRRQNETLRKDLDQLARQRDETQKELRKVTSSISLTEVEKRNLNVELLRTNKEAEDLRLKLQRYIDEVRRIEDLLQAKEEDLESILLQYRTLSEENTNLENYRSNLEHEASTFRKAARDAVEQTSTLRNQLSRQSTMVNSYEDEISRLSQQVASLETQLQTASASATQLNQDTSIQRDYFLTLEKKLDEARLKLADTESSKKKVEADNRDLKYRIEDMLAALEKEQARARNHEDLISKTKDTEFRLQNEMKDLMAEREALQKRIASLDHRNDQMDKDLAQFRMKYIETKTELERTTRQLESEKQERETAIMELKRLQEQLNTSSLNSLLASALESSNRSTTDTSAPSTSRKPTNEYPRTSTARNEGEQSRHDKNKPSEPSHDPGDDYEPYD